MINFTSEAVLTKFSSLLFSSLNLEDYLFSAWWMISFFEDSQFFTSFREHCTPERSFYHPQTSVSFRSLRIKFIPQLFQMPVKSCTFCTTINTSILWMLAPLVKKDCS